MKNIGRAVCFATLFLTSTGIGFAQATRTWVSGVGDDANPCSRTAPCKTWAGAISKTVAGGEMDALDPGGFGALTITKAITLDGGGGQVASTLVSGTNGITVSAGATDVVAIRNLRITGIDGTGSGGINGVRFNSGKELHLDHVIVEYFTNNGLDDEAPGSSVFVTDSIFHDNGLGACTSGCVGVFVSGASGFPSGTMRLTMVRSSSVNNVIGMLVKDNSRATVQDSYISNNTATGVWDLANQGFGMSELSLEHCVIANNGGAGVLAGDTSAIAPSDIWISNNEITNNGGIGVNVFAPNGHVWTYSNNRIHQNATDGCSNCAMMSLN